MSAETEIQDSDVARLSANLDRLAAEVISAFRARCVGNYKGGATAHRVTLNSDGHLILKPDNQPAYRLLPQQGRRFRIAELEGYSVEFRGATIIDEVIFHQPNGTFAAARIEG
jgi:hypothetical protein